MTQGERTRFTILLIILVVLVIVGVLVDRFRNQSSVGADILGSIENQAVATFKTEDGIDMEPTLSDISRVTVSSGVNTLTVNYQLGKRPTQSTKLDIQFFRKNEDTPLTTIIDKNGDQGTLVTKLKNIPDGLYDISVKPLSFLSQVQTDVTYANGKAVTLDYKDAFLWGDIDVSHGGKGDNKVNNADWSVLIAAWQTDNEKADFNGDGVINNADASILLNNWNKEGTRFRAEEATAVPSAPPEL